MSEEHFSIWLSMAARDRPIRNRLMPELCRAGYWNKASRGSSFSGVKFGRGAGVARVLAMSAGRRGLPTRSILTRTRIVPLQRGHVSVAVPAHLRYLVRSGQSEERRPILYGPDTESPDACAFARNCRDDRHQFRTILATEDACEYEDLRPLVRRLMQQAARDLRTRLDWVAADHYDTASPHTHIVIRGVDDRGDDLVIAREYINHGFRTRAAELVALDLGPDLEIDASPGRRRRLEIGQERATPIDRDLLASRDAQGRVWPDHPNRWEQAARAGRLRVLESLGLAHSDTNGAWYLQPDLAERLEEIAWRNRMARRPGLDRQAHPADGAQPEDGASRGFVEPGSHTIGPQLLSDDQVDVHFAHLAPDIGPSFDTVPRIEETRAPEMSPSRTTTERTTLQGRSMNPDGRDGAVERTGRGEGDDQAMSIGQLVQRWREGPEQLRGPE